MKLLISGLLAFLASAAIVLSANAQNVTAKVVTSCAGQSLSVNSLSPIYVDVTGVLCTTGGGSGGGGGTSSNFGATFPTAGTAIGLSDGSVMRDLTGINYSGSNYAAAISLVTALPAGSNAIGGVTQSGTWNINSITTLPGITFASAQPITASALPLPTGAATNAQLVTINSTLGSPFQAGGSIANSSFGISGTLPAYASTPTFNIGTSGSVASAANQTNIQSAAGTPNATAVTVQGNASGVPMPVSGTITVTGVATVSNQTNGNQKTQIVDGVGNVIASTSNNLNVQCANCSGSGVSTGDEASFTAGTSLFAGGGGFFQTTATNNALTNGQQGMFQTTANRALFTNLRNAAGTEVGTAGAPIQVSVANTSANSNAIKVDGSGVTQPISAISLPLPTGSASAANQAAVTGSALGGTSAANSVLVGGVYATSAPTLTNGQQASGQLDVNGNLKVAIAAGGGSGGTSSNFAAAFPTAGTAIGAKNGSNMVNLTADGSNNLNVNIATNATVVGTGTFAVQDSTTETNTSTIAGAVNSSVMQSNTKQVNGVTTLAGAGAVGTGAQRVAVGQDTTTIAGSAPGTAGSASTNVVTVQGVSSMTPVQVSQATAANLNATVVGNGTFSVQCTSGCSSTAAITPVVGGSGISNKVLKASAGSMFSVYDTPTADGWLMVFNAVSDPGDGATTAGTASGNLVDCVKAPAGVTTSINYGGGPPEAFSVGITAVHSSTACASKTDSATAFLHGITQ